MQLYAPTLQEPLDSIGRISRDAYHVLKISK